MRNAVSAQSLICGNNDNPERVEDAEEERVEDSEEERVEDSEEERVEDSEEERQDGEDDEISSLASQINCEIIIQPQNGSDDDMIPILDDTDVQERELVE